MKYINLFEAFESEKLSKTLKYIESYRNKIKELTSVNINGEVKDIPSDASFFNM